MDKRWWYEYMYIPTPSARKSEWILLTITQKAVQYIINSLVLIDGMSIRNEMELLGYFMFVLFLQIINQQSEPIYIRKFQEIVQRHLRTTR